MRPVRVVSRALCFALVLPGGATLAQATDCASRQFVNTPAPYEHIISRARHIICEDLAGRVPGIQVAAAVDGKLIWSEAFGFADIADGRPVVNTTMFRIGSISKPLTAEAVSQLVLEGRLDLDAPVQKYVPSFPVKTWQITSRQLAGHLSGVRGYLRDYEENRAAVHFPTVVAGLDIFARDSLLFRPGSRFSYSTYGYSLLSAALEGASGLSFPDLMRTRVFAPLGLLYTTMDVVDSVIPNRATPYDLDSANRRHPAQLIDNSYKWAGGGMLSTAEDLVQFGSNYLAPTSDSVKSNLLFRSQQTLTGEQTGYGIGWYVGKDSWGHRVASHSGSAVGGSSILVVDRDRKTVFAMTINITGTDAVGALLGPVWNEIPQLLELDTTSRSLLAAMNRNDGAAVLREYRSLAAQKAELAGLIENYVNELGYKRLHAADTTGALSLFRLNVEHFPNAFNTWDSLAEIELLQGDSAAAMKHYRESLRLNPKNENARRVLTRLGAL
jgi:serine beta-lactamase-like protein LACTB, mitochondrial